jgi:two-component system LytT family response regulator
MMKIRGPILTLVAVAVLGVAILLVNISKEEPPPPEQPAAQTTTATVVAPPPSPATPPPPAFPAKADYVGKVPTANGTITVDITVDGDKAIAYACDGNTVGPEGIQINEADGVENAVRSIHQKKPDLLLLDIQLKDGNGFEILQEIKNVDLQVIFITAYQEYAIKACKASALDYILKPVDPDELILAINKAQQKIDKEKIFEKLESFMENISRTDQQLRKITLKTADSIHIVLVDDIVYCEGSGNYTTFHMKDKKNIMVSKPIGEYEDLISNRNFIRTHQSFLVNMDHVLRYEKGDGGFIITKNNDSIPVSTRKKDQLMQYLQNM